MKQCVFILGQAFLLLSLLPGCQSSGSEAKTPEDAALPPALTVQVTQPVMRTSSAPDRDRERCSPRRASFCQIRRKAMSSGSTLTLVTRSKRDNCSRRWREKNLPCRSKCRKVRSNKRKRISIRARAEHARVKELAAEKLIPEQRLDISEADYAVAEAKVRTAEKILALARKRLRDTRIVSPVNGFIQERFVNPGEYKQDASPLLELVVVHPLKLRSPVPERFAAVAETGMSLRVEVEALPGQVFEGILTRMAARVNHKTRSLLIEAEIPNPDGKLRPGYFARITGVLGGRRRPLHSTNRPDALCRC